LRIFNTAIYFVANIILSQNTVGVISNTTSSFDGFTLFAPNTSTSTYLINNEGLLINEWTSEYVPGLSVYLLENGNLLRSSAIESQNSSQTGGFELLTWDNVLIWRFYHGKQHHDIEPLPNGNVLIIVNDIKTFSDAIEAGRDPEKLLSNSIRSLSILEISQSGFDSGDIVWEWHAWDHLIQDFDETKSNYGNVNSHPELIDINFAPNTYSDWLHTNSVDYNEQLDQVLVSNRNTNEIWIIDHSTTISEASSNSGGISGKGGDLLFRWGNPLAYKAGQHIDQRLFGQHDANWIKDSLNNYQNRIMIFNNGIDRPSGNFSTAIEINTPILEDNNYNILDNGIFGPSDEIWSYASPDTFDFFSPRFGSAQRLPNGNSLISNSEMGTFFELNSMYEIVWMYINPVSSNGVLFQGDSAQSNTVFRCYRYNLNYDGLSGFDLSPSGPIEYYLDINDISSNDRMKFNLFNNYPNPFNPKTRFSYYLPRQTFVELTIHNIKGQFIRHLISEIQREGHKTIHWDAKDSFGNQVTTGLYIYRLKTPEFVESKISIFIK